MLRKSTENAISILLAMDTDARASLHDIAATLSISASYAEQLARKLVKAGLIDGARGPKGGYILTRDKKHITVFDVAVAVAPDFELNARGYEKILKPHDITVLA